MLPNCSKPEENSLQIPETNLVKKHVEIHQTNLALSLFSFELLNFGQQCNTFFDLAFITCNLYILYMYSVHNTLGCIQNTMYYKLNRSTRYTTAQIHRSCGKYDKSINTRTKLFSFGKFLTNLLGDVVDLVRPTLALRVQLLVLQPLLSSFHFPVARPQEIVQNFQSLNMGYDN